MDTDVEDLESIIYLEKTEKKLSDGEKKLSDLREYHDKVVHRLRERESHGSSTTAVPTYEELKKMLTPAPPVLTDLSLYDLSPPTRHLEYCETHSPRQVSDQDVNQDVEIQLEQWRASLEPFDRAILRGEVTPEGEMKRSEVTPEEEMKRGEITPNRENCKENCEVKPQIADSTEQIMSNCHVSSDVVSMAMDIEYTTEVPKSMIVAPATEVKTSRRALYSHQTDSVKRTRRSARF
ncbi:uncharacterized protein LOC134820460 [Bolinopsis microptera]|uniref:uncharacterized protein LOC134820460 n=1 Tax=Bolinopsis microptera TaxID=2820187 RepID=UPI00307AE460